MRRVIITIVTISFVLLLFSANLLARHRGIRVKALIVDGSTKEIHLYSGYYALVVECGNTEYGLGLQDHRLGCVVGGNEGLVIGVAL